MSAPRLVTLVVCTDDTVLGSLPPVEVGWPYWQEVSEIVGLTRERHGVDVVVLRILSAEGRENGDGGTVAYAAQVDGDPASTARLPLTPWTGPDPLLDHPLRTGYARPGGPHADLTWAHDQLVSAGRTPSGPAEQQRTWNLSSIWRVPAGDGAVWLKSQPAWAVPEARLLGLLGALSDQLGVPRAVADVVATDGHRALLDDVEGADHYGAGPDVMAEAIEKLVVLQHHGTGLRDDLLALGVRDLRLEPAKSALSQVLDRYHGELTTDEWDRLEDLLRSLPERYDAARASGLPDTLVHGDFYQGNVRGVAGSLRLLDWADAGVGHPALDLIRLLTIAAPQDGPALTRIWAGHWRALRPGSDPTAALAPLRPVAELLDALIYQRFLDHIEPAEQRYHAGDPLTSLRAALALS